MWILLLVKSQSAHDLVVRCSWAPGCVDRSVGWRSANELIAQGAWARGSVGWQALIARAVSPNYVGPWKDQSFGGHRPIWCHDARGLVERFPVSVRIGGPKLVGPSKDLSVGRR